MHMSAYIDPEDGQLSKGGFAGVARSIPDDERSRRSTWISDAKVVDQPSGGTTLQMAGALFMIMTYLEDGVRLASDLGTMRDYSAEITGLPTFVSAIVMIVLALVQLSSVLLLVPLNKHPLVATCASILCVALACNVVLQPFLFNVWTSTHVVLSLAQLGSLAIFFADARAHAGGEGSERAASLMLIGRITLLVDLVCLSAVPGFISEVRRIYGSIVHSEAFDAKKQELIKEAREKHSASLMELHVDEHGAANAAYDLRIKRIHALFEDETSIFTDGYTALAALVMIVAGVLIALGYRARPVAMLAAVGALIDAVYRFPFFLGGKRSDFQRFHFFQAMTTVGGLLLIAAVGAGGLSLDAKMKKAR